MESAIPPARDLSGRVLDGGLGTHLEALGADVSGSLWSARILRDDPDLIVRAHQDFLAAGAQVLTTASYQVTAEGLTEAGIDPVEASQLWTRSVECAREAAARHRTRKKRTAEPVRSTVRMPGAESGADRLENPVWVAASIGPFGAGPGPGTEYDGAYGLSREQLRQWHAPRLNALDEAGADLLLAETIPSLPEVQALLDLAGTSRCPVALSITVAGDRLRDGTPLQQVAQELNAGQGMLVAVGVNCCSPSDAVGAVTVLAQTVGVPVIACPNSGETWDRAARMWTGRQDDLCDPARIARALRTAGAAAVGGCCRVGPEGIAAMAQEMTGCRER